MNTDRYVVNLTNDIRFADPNTILVRTLTSRFQLKGENMSAAVQEILNCFKEPTTIDDAVSRLAQKYTASSLQRLLHFLMERNILINERTAGDLRKHGKDFMDKALYYTLGGKSLQEITEELAPLRVGIIGPKQMVSCLLNDLVNGELLFNFNVGITDGETDVNGYVSGNINIASYPDVSGDLEPFTDSSDFIIACANYSDHYLFNQVNGLCIKKKKRWLRVTIDGDSAEIGPLFIPGKTCCYSCLRIRERFNLSKENYLFDRLYEDGKVHEDARKKPVGLYSLYYINSLASAIACAEMMKLLTGLKCNLENQIISVNATDYEMLTHTIFRYRLCPDCAKEL